jgi:hypothetical protein
MDTSVPSWEKILLRMHNQMKPRDSAPQSSTDEIPDQSINKSCVHCKQHSSTLPKLDKKVDDMLISVSYDEWSQK